MGYVDSAPGAFASSTVRSALLESLSGGVDYRSSGAADDKVQAIKNLWLEDGILTSRPYFTRLTGGAVSGKLHSAYSFCGGTALHIGTGLYLLADGELTALLDGLPDAHSIPVEFSGKLYFYCKAHIFSVSREGSAKEEFPTAPVYRYNCHSANQTGTYTADFKPNLLAPYVAVTFSSENREGTNSGYRFPRDMDKTRPFQIYFEDRLLAPSEYTATADKFDFKTLYQTVENSVMLCYYSTLEALDKSAELAACRVGTAFGGGTLDGTRVILAGNADKSGKYYMSELAEPLCFYENVGGTLGAGAEDVTAFSVQNGSLLIFTAHTISRMSYTYTSEHGGYYSVKLISSGIGCDMPGSVQSVDNRTVFASSAGGVYLVNNTNLFDGMNIVPISDNITDSRRQNGFFSVSGDALQAATSCLHDRKYLLCAGDKAFIWDYGAVSYVNSSDTVKAAKRLAWFVFEGMAAAVPLSHGGRLYLLAADTAQTETAGTAVLCAAASGDTAGESGYGASFRSKNHDLGYPHRGKAVSHFSLSCRTAEAVTITLEFFADGERYYQTRVKLTPKEDGVAVCSVKLPRRVLERFAFAISTADAGVGIFNIRLEYMLLKQNRMK